MTKEEFKEARKKLKLTQTGLGEELGVSNRTIQGYEYGHQKIPKTITIILRQKAEAVNPVELGETIELDVEQFKTLTLQQMAHFCLKHKEQFLAIPEMKLLIDFERKDAEAKLMEQHIILRNIRNKEE